MTLPSTSKQRLFGLTGGIASGKSAVAALFAELGAELIDADDLAHAVTQPGSPVLAEIQHRFGADLLSQQGELDRAGLAAIVFADASARKDLEAMIHPRIALLTQQAVQSALEGPAPLVLYVAPLIFEAGLDQWLPKVIVVDISPAQQALRLAARDGDEAQIRVKSQMPLAQKRDKGDYVIDNDGDFAKTQEQVRRLWQQLVDPS